VPLFTSGGLDLGLVILVLVLRIWSCLHYWHLHKCVAGFVNDNFLSLIAKLQCVCAVSRDLLNGLINHVFGVGDPNLSAVSE